MYLTKMPEQPEIYTLPLDQDILGKHDEVEILFENSLQDANSLVNVLEITKDRMRNTEALIMVKVRRRQELFFHVVVVVVVSLPHYYTHVYVLLLFAPYSAGHSPE